MSYDPINRRGQEAAREEQTLARKLQTEQLAADLQWLMGDPRGRRLMSGWLAACHIDHTTFTGDSKGMFREGMRNAGLMLKAQITTHAFEGFITMLREFNDGGGAHTTKGTP